MLAKIIKLRLSKNDGKTKGQYGLIQVLIKTIWVVLTILETIYQLGLFLKTTSLSHGIMIILVWGRKSRWQWEACSLHMNHLNLIIHLRKLLILILRFGTKVTLMIAVHENVVQIWSVNAVVWEVTPAFKASILDWESQKINNKNLRV